MYFLPLAWLEARTGSLPADFDASAIRLAGIIHNLVPVTLGNIVGGAGLVGAVYWFIYRAAFGRTRKSGSGRLTSGASTVRGSGPFDAKETT